MTDYTPGPWVVKQDGVIYTETGDFIGFAYNPNSYNPWDNEQELANAHLIAAAPALLQILETAVAEETAYNKGNNTWITKAKEAIAKAKGE